MISMLVVNPLIIAIGILITLAGSLQGQTTPITASISLSSKAYQYGGINVVLKVQNNLQKSILVSVSENDELLTMIGTDGNKYESLYRSTPALKTIELRPNATFVHEFEVESVGVVDTLFDNGGYGPIFDPIEYEATYPLFYHTSGAEEQADTFVVRGVFHIDLVSIDVQSAVDQYSEASKNVDMYWMSNFPYEQGVNELDETFQKYIDFIDECRPLHIHHRCLKAAMIKTLNHFPERKQAMLEKYLYEYPNSVHTGRFVAELKSTGLRDDFLNLLRKNKANTKVLNLLTGQN